MGFIGTDTLTYRATDGGLSSATATITINVTKPPVAPEFAWTFPTNPKRADFVDDFGTDFPLCRNCSDLVIQTAAPLPAYGTVTFKPRALFPGQMAATYTADTNETHDVIDTFDVVAGQMVDGSFQELFRATVSVTVLTRLR